MRKIRPHKLIKTPKSVVRFGCMQGAALAACLLLGACTLLVPQKSPVDDSTHLTRAEMCQHSCTSDYNRCYDASDTRFESYGEPRGVIGMGATCDYNLKNCLKACTKQ